MKRRAVNTFVLILFLMILSFFTPFSELARGASWEWQNPLPQGNSLRGVWVGTESSVFAVGFNGTILHYDGDTWNQMSSGTSLNFVRVWGSSGSDVFAVGILGAIVHYDGTTWTEMITPTGKDLLDVWGSSPNDVFVVGGEVEGSGITLHYDGTACGQGDAL